MPPAPDVTDEASTIARARTGDRDALHRIYRDTVGTVTRFVARRVPPSQVDDVVSETYVRALAGLGGYRDRGVPIRAWLLRIAWNLIVDAGRSGAGRTIPVPEIAEPPASLDPASDWIDQHDARATLRRAFAALEPGQRAAVWLRHLEDLSVAEVAAMLGTTEVAVRALSIDPSSPA